MFKPILCAALSVLCGVTAAHAQSQSSQGTIFYQFFNRTNKLVDKVPKGDINSQITRSAVAGGPQLLGVDCYGITCDPNTRQMCFVRSVIISKGNFQGDYSAFYVCNLDGTNAHLLQRERADYSGLTRPVANFTPFYASNGDLLFETDNRIARMNGDGSNVRFLTGASDNCGLPSEGNGMVSFEKSGVCICNAMGKERRRIEGFSTYYGVTNAGPYSDVRISPDGTQIVFIRDRKVFVASTSQSNPEIRSVSNSSTINFDNPVWSPDGRSVAVAGTVHGSSSHDIYLIDLSTGELRQITNTPDDELPRDWRLV